MFRHKTPIIDRELVIMILSFYLIAYAIDFLSILLMEYTTGQSSLQNYSLLSLTVQYLFTYVAKLFYLFIAVIFTIKLFEKTAHIVQQILVHTFLAFGLSFYTAFLTMSFRQQVLNEDISVTFESIWVRGLNGLSFNVFVYACILGLTYAYHYFRIREDQLLIQEKLKGQLSDAKLNALQSQLQPHFLFNTMNDISSLIDINPVKAQDAISDLCNLLRSTLKIKDLRFITLDRELDMLTQYLDIEKLRYGNKLLFEIDIDKSLMTQEIPPLIFQPLVENAVKHGFSKNKDQLKIEIKTFRKQDFLYLKIINNGEPLTNEKPFPLGNGISNIIERMENLYPGNYTFQFKNIESPVGNKVEFYLSLPIKSKT